jgi:tetratricopeptide (TPR) repeat protein
MAMAAATWLMGHAAAARAGAWSSAAELTRQGRRHASEGEEALATRRFAEATALDPTFGPAYLELAEARERAGDLGEALRVYDAAIQHVPRFAAAYRARAAVERRLGLSERESASLQSATRLTDDAEMLRDIAAEHAENRAWPAALAVWRKLLTAAADAQEPAATHDAEVHVQALTILCTDLDPVSAGARGRGWVRRAVASIALRTQNR